MTAPAAAPILDREPIDAGWYSQRDTNGTMIFSAVRTYEMPGDVPSPLQWYAHTVEGWSSPCVWEYIAQAGPVYRIELPE